MSGSDRSTTAMTRLTAANWTTARAAAISTPRARPNPASWVSAAAATASTSNSATSGQPNVTMDNASSPDRPQQLT